MEKILLLSPDEGMRQEFGAALEAEGFQLSLCDPRAWSEEHFYRELPDLILLDRRPSESGDLLRRIASRIAGHDIPVILLGEYGDPREWAADLEQGGSDFLELPYSLPGLKAKLRVWSHLKRRLDQLKIEAVVDELTGLFNRRFLESQLAARLGEARRYHHPISFLIVDFDHFKQINDTLGHPFGDLVLRESAALMRQLMRKEDILARYGGEEFAIILPHTDHLGIGVLGERIRAAIAARSFTKDGKTWKVTVSGGGATYPLDEVDSAEELVACADRRLYQAKEKGRNHVIYA